MKHRTRYAIRKRVAAVAVISMALCLSLSSFPTSVSADIIGVQTRALIPVEGSSCVSLSAYGFTAYEYDGALHSFEFTVPDSSYVALSGSVGNTSIPFQFMTRRGAGDALRVHVDIATTPITGTLPIRVVLVSAKGAQQSVCMAAVIMSVQKGGQSSDSSVAGNTVSPVQPSTPVTVKPNLPRDNGEDLTTGTTTPSVVGTSSVVATAPSILAGLQNAVLRSCAVTNGAIRLWIILLAVYAIMVALVVFVEHPALRTYSLTERAVTIVIPFILLFGFWYIVESCRATPWAPIGAMIIALLGVAALYRNDSHVSMYSKRAQTLFTVKSEESQKPSSNAPMITPPPASKPKPPTQPPTK